MTCVAVGLILRLMVKLSEIINASFEWTAVVLFKPFRLKKWLVLGFVAWLSGSLIFGTRINVGDIFRTKSKKAEAAYSPDISLKKSPPSFQETLEKVITKVKSSPRARALIIAAALFFLALIILFIWLSSRFIFIFIEDIVKNDASIVGPFRANREQGNSLFLFRLVVLLVCLAIIGLIIFGLASALIKTGVFHKNSSVGFKQIFFACLPFGLMTLLFLAAVGLLQFIVGNFVTIVMLKDKICFRSAWPKTMELINANIGNFVKFFFLEVGLGLCALILASLISLIETVWLMIPVGLLATFFGLISVLLPVALRQTYFVVLVIIMLPPALFILYGMVCSYLPFSVFFRTLTLKFMARISEQYNLFNYTEQPSLAQPSAKIGERSPVLAAILSFGFPGAGQIYNGQVLKGLLVFFFSWLIFPWVLGVVDAYTTCQKINQGEIEAKNRVGCLIAFIIASTMLVFVILFALIIVGSYLSSLAK